MNADPKFDPLVRRRVWRRLTLMVSGFLFAVVAFAPAGTWGCRRSRRARRFALGGSSRRQGADLRRPLWLAPSSDADRPVHGEDGSSPNDGGSTHWRGGAFEYARSPGPVVLGLGWRGGATE